MIVFGGKILLYTLEEGCRENWFWGSQSPNLSQVVVYAETQHHEAGVEVGYVASCCGWKSRLSLRFWICATLSRLKVLLDSPVKSPFMLGVFYGSATCQSLCGCSAVPGFKEWGSSLRLLLDQLEAQWLSVHCGPNPVVQCHLRINIVAQIKGKPNNKVYCGIETKYSNEQSSLLLYHRNLVQRYRSATAEAINSTKL